MESLAVHPLSHSAPLQWRYRDAQRLASSVVLESARLQGALRAVPRRPGCTVPRAFRRSLAHRKPSYGTESDLEPSLGTPLRRLLSVVLILYLQFNARVTRTGQSEICISPFDLGIRLNSQSTSSSSNISFANTPP